MFKRQTSDIQFIGVTLVLVLLLGARTFYSLTEDEALPVESAVASSASVASATRSPSSLPKNTVKFDSGLEQFTQFDLSCTKKSVTTVSVQGSFVQFQGKNCVKSLQQDDVEIVNKSNGYTASIFKRGTDKYQTDLIQLKAGDNEIAIRYRERSGKSVEEVVRVHSTKI